MKRSLRKFGAVSKKTSQNMKKIKSNDTSIELILRKALWHKGYRYRKNYKVLPGSPDIVITKYRIAIFCDSEFFHGKDWTELECRLKKGKNPDYWVAHIEENMARDQKKDKLLKYDGWTVIHFWGKELKRDPDACVKVIEETIFDNMLAQNEEPFEIT